MLNYQSIQKLVGRDAYFNARYSYYYDDVSILKTTKMTDRFSHRFKIARHYSNVFEDVEVVSNGEKIYSFSCSCDEFSKLFTCEHVAAVLIKYADYISEYEIIDELAVSKQILEKYYNSKNVGIREKLNVEYEFFCLPYDVTFKFKIGLNKLYVINNDSKLMGVKDALDSGIPYYFGKQFTLDLSHQYFEENDLNILKYLLSKEKQDNYYSYRDSSFSMTYREFEYVLLLLKGKTFTIDGYGKINDIVKGLPTNFKLDMKDNIYTLKIDDINSYQYLNNDYVIYKNKLYILTDEEKSYIKLLNQSKINNLSFKKEDLNKFSSGIFKNIKGNLTISDKINDIKLPTKPTAKLYFDISNNLECKLIFEYNKDEINYFDDLPYLRDAEEESIVVNKLLDKGFLIKDKKFVMEDEDNIYDFLDNELIEFSEQYEIFTSKRIKNTSIMKGIKTNSNFSIGEDGILSYNFSAEGINQDELANVFKALVSKKKYYKLSNNNVISFKDNDDLANLNDMLSNLDLSREEINLGITEIPKYRALYIDSLKSNSKYNITTNNSFDDFINNFKKYKNLKVNFDSFDNATLRDYQKDGVKWLTTIYKCGFGGILADEMGLGKSIQTISFIKQVLKEKKNAKIIIVAPTALIYNWEKEFQMFGEDIKYVVVAENKGKRLDILKRQDDYNVFITTYGLIRNDNDEYEHMNFEVCIIDEAQAIKNYQAGMTREVKKIKAECKIALTGTPVENNVTELWSIFDFLMPGYLSSVIKFREKYNIKDVKEDDLKVLNNLNYLVSPFILRRKKKDVIKSLPDKIEKNIYLDLPKEQKMIYLKELEDTKREIDNLIATGGYLKSRFRILTLIGKLRQICIDPSVLYENYDGQSVKIEELINIIKNNMGEHKILIFSSFKRVLDNVAIKLKEESISYYMIDGTVKSKDRMNMVEAFNKDNTNCFLITLKSGGTGLNLVGADIVIHLDIWWNPQVENQATDRAHRIGQDKNVTVIKLITKGTLEERILELQEKKKILSDNLIEGRTGNESLSSLQEEDIKKMLASFDEDA